MTSSIEAISLVPMTDAEDAGAGERDLVRAAQLDGAAFDILYRRYVTRIYRYTVLKVGSEQDALDLTQQIFLRALDALPRYRLTDIPFGAWMFRIARNAVTDHHRRHKASVPWELVPQSLHPVSTDNPEAAALSRESHDELRTLLASQDEYRRELLALRFAGGLPVREIAAIVKKPEATVKSDLRRTLLRLKGLQHED
jgi:RNA polymerase sigma-70 factor, ECF subfamily